MHNFWFLCARLGSRRFFIVACCSHYFLPSVALRKRLLLVILPRSIFLLQLFGQHDPLEEILRQASIGSIANGSEGMFESKPLRYEESTDGLFHALLAIVQV